MADKDKQMNYRIDKITLPKRNSITVYVAECYLCHVRKNIQKCEKVNFQGDQNNPIYICLICYDNLD